MAPELFMVLKGLVLEVVVAAVEDEDGGPRMDDDRARALDRATTGEREWWRRPFFLLLFCGIFYDLCILSEGSNIYIYIPGKIYRHIYIYILILICISTRP